jgi:hypothetical protein
VVLSKLSDINCLQYKFNLGCWNYCHHLNYINCRPNVVVEWVTLLLRVREVQHSNVGPETGYPD